MNNLAAFSCDVSGLRSHRYPGNWAAIVYHARSARAFSAAFKSGYCNDFLG